MSARARAAAVLRQPLLADEARMPGRAAARASGAPLERGGENTNPMQGAAHPAQPMPSNPGLDGEPSAIRFDAEAAEAEIERRATIAAESLIERQRAAWIAQAREEGYAQGVQSGREAVEREWAALAARAQALLQAVKDGAARERQASTELALHLTFASLRKIFGEAFASNAGAQAAIANALAQTEAQSVEVIRVAPQDIALVAGTDQSSGLLGPLPKDVAVEADERVAPGGCVIETRRGAFDGRIESQLERLLDAIRQAYEARRAVDDAREGAA